MSRVTLAKPASFPFSKMGSITTIAPESLAALSRYSWPGNVRELSNFIERCVILTQGATLDVPAGELKPRPNAEDASDESLERMERQHILRALEECNWVIAGPAGAPSSVEIPLRVAVVQGGIQEKTIATKVYRTSVAMSESGSEPFSLVAEDLVYPAPPGAVGDSYIFYIGFDPQALKPEPKPKATKKK